MEIHKGDVVVIPVPFTDNIGFRIRPAVVISNDAVHSTGDAIIVQITSKQKNDGLSLEIFPGDLSLSLPVKSYIRFHKIFVLEKTLIKNVVSKLSPEAYNKLIEKIMDTIR